MRRTILNTKHDARSGIGYQALNVRCHWTLLVKLRWNCFGVVLKCLQMFGGRFEHSAAWSAYPGRTARAACHDLPMPTLLLSDSGAPPAELLLRFVSAHCLVYAAAGFLFILRGLAPLHTGFKR